MCAMNLQGSADDAISMKLQSNFAEIALWHGCSTMALLRIFGATFPKNVSGGLLLLFLLFFCFVINPRGEIRIQLDVSLWSLER